MIAPVQTQTTNHSPSYQTRGLPQCWRSRSTVRLLTRIQGLSEHERLVFSKPDEPLAGEGKAVASEINCSANSSSDGDIPPVSTESGRGFLPSNRREQVGVTGIEPAHLAVLDPKSSASASSATLPGIVRPQAAQCCVTALADDSPLAIFRKSKAKPPSVHKLFWAVHGWRVEFKRYGKSSVLIGNSATRTLVLGVMAILSAGLVLGQQPGNPAEIEGVPVTASITDFSNMRAFKGSLAGIDCFGYPTGERISHVDGQFPEVRCFALLDHGRSMLVGGGQAGRMGAVDRYRIDDQGRLTDRVRLAEFSEVVYGLAINHEQDHWAACLWDGTCQLFGMGNVTPELTYSGHSGPVLAITFIDEEMSIASAGVDGTIQIWDGRSGRRLRSLDNHIDSIHCLAVRPHASASRSAGQAVPPVWLASASEDRTIRFWQPSIGRMVRFAKLTSVPREIEWTLDGAWLMVRCDGGARVRVNPLTAQVSPVEF